jgi:hypothetical protein
MSTIPHAVIGLPRAAFDQLASFARRTPAFRPIIDRLSDVPESSRLRCELLLARLLQRALYSPRLSAEDAVMVLDHSAASEAITEEELHLLASGPTTCKVYDLWREVWEDEEDLRVRDRIRYCAALLARLYRLEYQVRFEASAI